MCVTKTAPKLLHRLFLRPTGSGQNQSLGAIFVIPPRNVTITKLLRLTQ